MSKLLESIAKREGRLHDAQLDTLCNAWQSLPEFEWTAGPIVGGNEWAEEKWECKPKLTRHITHNPHNDLFFVMFKFRNTRVFFAKGKFDRLSDLCRYADVLTHRLWPYRERGLTVKRLSFFNLTPEDAERDLEHWLFNRPDILDLMNAQIQRLEELDVITLPENRKRRADVHSKSRTRTVAGKVESVLAYQKEEILDLLNVKHLAFQNLFNQSSAQIAALDARFDRLEKILAGYNPASKEKEDLTTGKPGVA